MSESDLGSEDASQSSSGVLELVTILVAAVLAGGFLYANYAEQSTNFEELAFPEGTGGYYASYDGHLIHCRGIEGAQECVDGFRARGSADAALWVGNSQIHAVNQLKEGQQNAPHILSQRLRARGLDLLTYSQPNATLVEHFIIFTWLRQRVPLRVLFLPLVFDDLRAPGVRASVAIALDDPGTVRLLERHEVGRRVISEHENDSVGELAALHQTGQERSEAALTGWLSEHFRLWELRSEARGYFYRFIMDLRNAVFGITAQSKRKLLPGLYARNMAAAEAILSDAREAGVAVVAYICPIRNDVEIPYLASEYDAFKRRAEELARAYGAIFVNLEDIVPPRYWGSTHSTNLSGDLELDFAHFQTGGHAILAAALEEQAVRNELVQEP